MDRRTVLEEIMIPVVGSTKLWIGDQWYKGDKDEKSLIFSGNISSAPFGLMQIQKVKIEFDEYGGGEYEDFIVTVYQASNIEKIKTYKSGKFYTGTVKKEMALGCDTACFDIITKHSSDHFDTGGDGNFGYITQFKQYFGMILTLSFDCGLYSFDEIKERMLCLFKEDKKNGEQILAAVS